MFVDGVLDKVTDGVVCSDTDNPVDGIFFSRGEADRAICVSRSFFGAPNGFFRVASLSETFL